MSVQGHRRIDDERWDHGQPGDFWFAVDSEGNTCTILFWCPCGCGDTRHADLSQADFYKVGERPFWWWDKNKDSPTLRPSLDLKNPPPGIARENAGPISGWPTHWHGWLTNGVFTQC